VFEIFIVIISFISGFFIKYLLDILSQNRSYRLKLYDKIVDKKIQACDVVLDISKELRLIQQSSTNEYFDDGTLKRYPMILKDFDSFYIFWTHLTNTFNSHSTWIDINSQREINFLQDYLINLNSIIYQIKEEELYKIREDILYDFIGLSSNIEKSIKNYYLKDFLNIKIIDKSQWHKFKKEETIEKLNQTKLFQIYLTDNVTK
jgi:hypothetical protein